VRTLGRTARGHESDVLGPTAEVSQHETYRREWIGRDGNAGARLGAALGQQRLAMRAVLLAGANPAPSEGNHTERGDYFRTGASFAASISICANHWLGQDFRYLSKAECRCINQTPVTRL
jgi:hypothetical protein